MGNSRDVVPNIQVTSGLSGPRRWSIDRADLLIDARIDRSWPSTDWEVAVPESDEWQLQILVPPRPNAEKPFDGLFDSREIEVPASQVREQWNRTLEGLMSLAEDWSAGHTNNWHVAEVKVGMTLSAKGHLLFIAEAGAAATVEIKLTRGGVAPGD